MSRSFVRISTHKRDRARAEPVSSKQQGRRDHRKARGERSTPTFGEGGSKNSAGHVVCGSRKRSRREANQQAGTKTADKPRLRLVWIAFGSPPIHPRHANESRIATHKSTGRSSCPQGSSDGSHRHNDGQPPAQENTHTTNKGCFDNDSKDKEG